MSKQTSPLARLEPTQIEVGTGRGYRWAPGYHVITPDGAKLYPPVPLAEARAMCAASGWRIAPPDKSIRATYIVETPKEVGITRL